MSFGIANDILIVGYDADGRDHYRTLREVIGICQRQKLKIYVIQVCKHTIFGEK